MKIIVSEKRDKNVNLIKELKRVYNRKVSVIPVVVGALGTISQMIEKETERVGNLKTNRSHLDCSIIKIGLNTEKSPGEFRTWLSRYITEWKSKKMKMMVTVMLNVIGALRTVPKCLGRGMEELEIGGRAVNIQTAVLLRSDRILRSVLKPWWD